MYLSMIIILTHFHLLLAESILRTRELLKCYFYQFEECSPRGDIRIEITVLPRSIGPRFIANLAYRQNSRLSRFPPLKIPFILPSSATAIRHRFSDTKVVKPI